MFVPMEIETEGISPTVTQRMGKAKQKQYVCLYGLSASETAQVKSQLPSRQCEVLDTDQSTDLLACGAYAIIFRSDVVRQDEFEMIRDCFVEVPYYVEVPIMIGDAELPASVRSRFKIYPDFETLAPDLKYLLMTGLRKQKKNKAFYNSLATAIQLLSLLRGSSGYTTKQLAEQLEISARSAQRYIETLRVAGEWIVYDSKSKCWKLEIEGKSALWGDLDE